MDVVDKECGDVDSSSSSNISDVVSSVEDLSGKPGESVACDRGTLNGRQASSVTSPGEDNLEGDENSSPLSSNEKNDLKADGQISEEVDSSKADAGKAIRSRYLKANQRSSMEASLAVSTDNNGVTDVISVKTPPPNDMKKLEVVAAQAATDRRKVDEDTIDLSRGSDANKPSVLAESTSVAEEASASSANSVSVKSACKDDPVDGASKRDDSSSCSSLADAASAPVCGSAVSKTASVAEDDNDDDGDVVVDDVHDEAASLSRVSAACRTSPGVSVSAPPASSLSSASSSSSASASVSSSSPPPPPRTLTATTAFAAPLTNVAPNVASGQPGADSEAGQSNRSADDRLPARSVADLSPATVSDVPVSASAADASAVTREDSSGTTSSAPSVDVVSSGVAGDSDPVAAAAAAAHLTTPVTSVPPASTVEAADKNEKPKSAEERRFEENVKFLYRSHQREPGKRRVKPNLQLLEMDLNILEEDSEDDSDYKVEGDEDADNSDPASEPGADEEETAEDESTDDG